VNADDDTSVMKWPAMLTWRSHDLTRIESTRVHVSGNRIKAYGRIAAAATDTHPAFSASYDLVTEDNGATNRLSLTVSLAALASLSGIGSCRSPATRRTCG